MSTGILSLYETLPLAHLRAVCRAIGLECQGTKQEIVKQLTLHLREVLPDFHEAAMMREQSCLLNGECQSKLGTCESSKQELEQLMSSIKKDLAECHDVIARWRDIEEILTELNFTHEQAISILRSAASDLVAGLKEQKPVEQVIEEQPVEARSMPQTPTISTDDLQSILERELNKRRAYIREDAEDD